MQVEKIEAKGVDLSVFSLTAAQLQQRAMVQEVFGGQHCAGASAVFAKCCQPIVFFFLQLIRGPM